MNYSVVFKNVTKKYKMYNKSSEKLLDLLLPNRFGEDFYALQNISFTAEPGDVIGIIGVNGAGKSTLSNLITGVIPPTSGEIIINGQASLISIASGLNNQLTGRENIELKCLMLGFSKKEIDELMPEIIDFADIGKFIDQPVKRYSSGMKSRLGFAISVHIDPDILVIDEALSVGDQTFTDKCLEKMNEFRVKGKTIFFISHSITQVRKFCQKALWLEAGEIKAYGTIQEIIPQYQKFLKEFKAMSKEEQKNFRQLVLERRSQLREPQDESVNNEVIEGMAPKRQSRVKRKSLFSNARKYILLLLLLLGSVAGGAAFAVKTGLWPMKADKSAAVPKEEKNPSEQTVEVEEKADIRYVTAPVVNIRSNPSIDSTSIEQAMFGQSFEIQEIHRDTTGREWLKILLNEQTTGWVSGELMSTIETELEDEEVTKQIDELIPFVTPIKEIKDMIGVKRGGEQEYRNVQYEYEANEVTGITLIVGASTETAVIQKLGEPQLKSQGGLLYHGVTNDYIFKVLANGKIDTITILKR
ncbi:teichoic acids export ABC transporter ATP-binding subunit TagH [Calidifontibacillus erzurumensis]|uniref:teichoic acids export ABC transporter ATP-binding subunit TagH n=1 Tax=Calidifontibacillus erzurumensis TaxID=2741433 RepID=UPI0035B51D8B